MTFDSGSFLVVFAADEAGDARSDAGHSAHEVVLDAADRYSSQLPHNVPRARSNEYPRQPEQGGDGADSDRKRLAVIATSAADASWVRSPHSATKTTRKLAIHGFVRARTLGGSRSACLRRNASMSNTRKLRPAATRTAITSDNNIPDVFQRSFSGADKSYLFIDQGRVAYWTTPTGNTNASLSPLLNNSNNRYMAASPAAGVASGPMPKMTTLACARRRRASHRRPNRASSPRISC